MDVSERVKTLIKNATIYTGVSSELIEGHLLIEDGRISNIGTFDIPTDISETIDATGKVVMPGLINAHAHSYTGLLKGTVDNVPLDIYMLNAIAGGSYRSPEEIYVSTMMQALEMLKSGTTSVIDHFSERPKSSIEGIGSVVQAFADSGMRATIAPMYADKSYFETVPMKDGEFPDELKGKSTGKPQGPEEYIEVVEEAIQKFHGYQDKIRIMLGTDGPQRCSEELLRLTGELENKYKVGWQTHMLEAKTQAVMGHKLHGKGLVEKLDELGLINERTSFVHFVWASDKEAQIVIDRGANMIHCAYSNLILGSGIANVFTYLKNGMKVAIGTDGGNCGNVNMFEKIRLSTVLHRVNEIDYEDWLTAEEALELSLRGGSRAMLQEKEIGSLEIGKQADFLILDTRNTYWEPVNHIIRQLVFYETGSSIESVFVAGQKVVHQGKSLLVDEVEMMKQARDAAARIQRDNKAAFELVTKQAPYFREMYLSVPKQEGFTD